MSSNLYLIRHGQSTYNLENRFTGWKDISLTNQGVNEAKIAGKLIKKNNIFIDLIFSSVLQRANETAIMKILNHLNLLLPVEKILLQQYEEKQIFNHQKIN